MKLSRQFTVFGSAVFCVVIFSLYLMLDRGHFDHPKSPRREGTFPKVSGAVAEARRVGERPGRQSGGVGECSGVATGSPSLSPSGMPERRGRRRGSPPPGRPGRRRGAAAAGPVGRGASGATFRRRCCWRGAARPGAGCGAAGRRRAQPFDRRGGGVAGGGGWPGGCAAASAAGRPPRNRGRQRKGKCRACSAL